MQRSSKIIFCLVLMVVWISCKKEEQQPDSNQDQLNPEYYSGGSTTSFDASASAFRRALCNLGAEGISLHSIGDAFFHQEFYPIGSSNAPGLGPLFIETSCASCHIQNGRGNLITNSLDGFLLRISIPGSGVNGEPLGIPGYGGQLQTNAIAGASPEGDVAIIWEDVPVTFPDGYQVILKQPYFSINNPYSSLPPFYLKGGRTAPPIYGAGLLDAVSDETLLAIADEFDDDGDGISGKINRVWNKQTNSLTIGRFGWKSSNPNALQQTAEAFNQDMGITSFLFPIENCEGQSNCVGGTQEGGDISNDVLNATNYYILTLAPPAPRNLEYPNVMRGKQLFSDLACAKCHLPEITTGVHPISELSNQVIRPYTDLLLHELGAGLGDGRPDYDAGANEWRTPPLWGIGLTKIVNPNAGYLHDGRAATLEEAILWHEGEAEDSKVGYMNLSAADRAAVIAFLEAL